MFPKEWNGIPIPKAVTAEWLKAAPEPYLELEAYLLCLICSAEWMQTPQTVLDELPTGYRLIWRFCDFYSDVLNGGFIQYLGNKSRDEGAEIIDTIEVLRRFGLNDIANMLLNAITLYGADMPQAVLATLSKSEREQAAGRHLSLDELLLRISPIDDKLIGTLDEIISRVDEYIKRHPEEFVHEMLSLESKPPRRRKTDRNRNMRIIAKGLVFDVTGRPETEQVNFFDSLYPLQNGDWLCGFTIGPRKHDPDGTIRLSRSRDGGNTWSEIPFRFETRIGGVPGSLAGSELVEVAPGELLLFTTWFDRSDRERPLFDPSTEGLLHSKLLVAESNDHGETFGPFREIPTPGLTGTALCGPPVHWSDGSIGLAFESFKHYDDPQPAWHAAWLVVSRDGGQTFPQRFLIAEDATHAVYYWDERLVPTSTPGEYIGLFWTHDRSAKKDLPVHFQRSALTDGERARMTPVDTQIPGQIAAPLLLDDGRVLGFVVDRDSPGTMKLWQSRDGGRTWPADEALTVHVHAEQARLSQGKENVDFAAYWEDMAKWSFGHPSIRAINPREVLLTFYAGPPNHLSIHWARVNLE